MARPTFPKTLREFRERFATESACLNYFWESRWAEGFRCPQCGSGKAWPLGKRRVWECQGCGLQISPTAGTLLHRSHFPLREWFWGAYLVATHTPGLSATQLQRQLGCTYRTAWFLLQRLRRAMVNAGRSPLAGRIEADEVIVGGPVRGKTGRGVTKAEHSTLVFGAVEVIAYQDKHGDNLEKAGRFRLAVAERADAVSIRSFLTSNVLPGSVINTDGWKGYSKTALAGYRHELHDPETHALHIHRAFGNLKTWLNGTHHGVDPKYLQHYLNEFVFRFNRRKTPMAAFQTLLDLASERNHVPLKSMVQPESKV